ncbi:UNVERIFIED_CONTAM: hypothetical protein Slati_2497400 [Sesamum latifolium]|uniref:Uncharacterized protein n=1 Tax=Sesamum latifolium TaxID=2727402 RepID=A0AAW2WGF0_9LAMI
MINSYNKRVRSRSFQVRDLVLRRADTLKPVGQLDPTWEGSYKVTGIIGKGVYELEDPGTPPAQTLEHSQSQKILCIKDPSEGSSIHRGHPLPRPEEERGVPSRTAAGGGGSSEGPSWWAEGAFSFFPSGFPSLRASPSTELVVAMGGTSHLGLHFPKEAIKIIF